VGLGFQVFEINDLKVVDQTEIDAASERDALDAPLSPVGTPPTNECEELVDQTGIAPVSECEAFAA
jgi:hypothetical protein